MVNKSKIKNFLGEIPFAPEIYWQFRQRGKPIRKNFSLRELEKRLPEMCNQVNATKPAASSGQHVVIFSTLRYWIEHATLLGLAMAGLGHKVSFLYLPYANFRRSINRFDLRRQNAYARSVLAGASSLLAPVSLLDIKPANISQMPRSLMLAIQDVSLRDTQYTLQIEDVDRQGLDTDSARLYRLRIERNLFAAGAAMAWIQSLKPEERPNILLTPNGSILEMGAIYQVARHLNIPVVTYEFGEQRGRIWLAQNSEVMLQETGETWATFKDKSLSEDQWEQVRALYNSRQNASLWQNFARLWQGLPSQGGKQAMQALKLDDTRPVVLLAANVIGDSLTLGRQVFSSNMTEWLQRTIQFFAPRTDVQLIVRIHPGERYIKGPSVAEVVRQALPEIPPHIHLVEAPDPINTYDLVEVADLGLVYTTTVGMEMAMSGVPVIVCGHTHYRDKNFTLDPASWEEYQELLASTLANPQAYRLSREQTESAWHYAYRFFFDFPCLFPWHLLDFWKELDTWSMARVLSSEGQAIFGETFSFLAGEPRRWSDAVEDKS